MNARAWRLPGHVALILDGNRRWARRRNLPLRAAYEAGEARFAEAIRLAATKDAIQEISCFLFAESNWQRPPDQVRELLAVLQAALPQRTTEWIDSGVRVSWVGVEQGLSDSLVRQLETCEQLTRSGDRLRLNLCLNYSGARDIWGGGHPALERHAWNSNAERSRREAETIPFLSGGVGQVDLIVRTSGEHRLSGFLPIQALEAEVAFVSSNWPDFDAGQLTQCLSEFSSRRRTLGGGE
jgi:undecaprenyl diphosphate synthase